MLCPVGQGSSFSGAGLWRVEHRASVYVLRRWPDPGGDGCRITQVSLFQQHLAAAGLPVASPLPLLEGDGALVFTRIRESRAEVATWTLSPWLPGVADYSTFPRAAKLKAAFRTLADLHLAATSFPAADAAGPPRTARSPGLVKRADRLEALKSAEWAELHYHLTGAPPTLDRGLAFEAMELIQRLLGRLWNESLRWADEPLPLQWVLRDVWHDHILFEDDRVTGVLDFGAAAVDSPAGDVARLLGSLVGDDADGWRAGIAAYTSRRPLSPIELEAVRYFDASGTLLAAFNWVHWLHRDPAALGANVDLAAAANRLRRLTNRLRFLGEVN